MPLEKRTIEAWKQAFPREKPATPLPIESSDSELIGRVHSWIEMLSKNDPESALDLIPDCRKMLPLSDFPIRQVPASPASLRKTLGEFGITLPTVLMASPEATLVRRYPRNAVKHFARQLACGLGSQVAAIEAALKTETNSNKLVATFLVFEATEGLVLTYKNIDSVL